MLNEKKPTSDELLKNGSVTIRAKTRQEIYAQAEMLVASLPQGTKWTRSVCQYHPKTFDFEQTISIIK